MKTYSTFEAKNKLSQVIASAESGEPSLITRNGKKSAVVVSWAEFERMKSRKQSLHEFLLNSPLSGSDIDLTRSPDTGGRETLDFSE